MTWSWWSFVAGWLASYAACGLLLALPLLVGRWMARRRIRRAVRELIGTERWPTWNAR